MRDIDRLQEYVRNCEYIRGPVIRQVLVNRLENPPTQEELDVAHDQLYGNAVSILESPATVAETRNTEGKSLLDEGL